jgi:hypothetical protein
LTKLSIEFFSIDWFEKLIATRTNGLVNPEKWDDPFENFFLRSKAQMSEGTLVGLESISKDWYGQCWTRNKDSDAMWRIYSKDKTGVRVSTTIAKLFSGFYDAKNKFASLKYLIGSVIYVDRLAIENFLATTSFTDLAKGGQPHNFAKTLLMKRPEFSHEQEVRLLFNDCESNHGGNGVAIFPFHWEAIISDVALDPRLTEAEYEAEKRKILAMGFNFPIAQSELYRFTPTTIRL